MIERPPTIPAAPIFDVDVSAGWDTASHIEIFMKALRGLPFYKPGLLYSGFNAKSIGTRSFSKFREGVIFCGPEENLEDLDNSINNPFQFALKYNQPAISVYDPSKLRKLSVGEEINMPEYNDLHDEGSEAYKFIDPSALIATIRINFKKPLIT